MTTVLSHFGTMKYFFDYFNNRKYDDDFGYNEIWNCEIDKWLELLYKIDKNFYEKGKTRVLNKEQRYAFLGEVLAIYYCHHNLKAEDIKLEPIGEGNKELDFSYLDRDRKRCFVEVKSPSWQGEVWKNPDKTKAQKKGRTEKPQYITEAGSFSPRSAFVDSIKNALPKFKKGERNMDCTPKTGQNMLVRVASSHPLIVKRDLETELNRQDPQKLISAVAVLETVLYEGENKIEYKYKYFNRKKNTWTERR